MAEEVGSKVQVYIYDLSMGLAAQLSPLFLGKQINGIWHTGIVAYGREWFFGGEGIMNAPPGGMIIGPPHRIEDLGHTEIPEEIFLEYLKEIGDKFCGSTYDLFHNNCNSFSNEVAQFLISKTIPSYITNLPQEVLETPFGAQIKPMLDSLQGMRGSDVPPSNPFNPVSNGAAAAAGGIKDDTVKFPESDVMKIVSNGFTRSEAIDELKKCNGDVDKALVQLLAKAIRF